MFLGLHKGTISYSSHASHDYYHVRHIYHRTYSNFYLRGILNLGHSLYKGLEIQCVKYNPAMIVRLLINILN